MRQLQKITIISNISVTPFFIPQMQEDLKLISNHIIITAVSEQEYREHDYKKVLDESGIVIVWLNIETLLPELHNGNSDINIKKQQADNIIYQCRNMTEYISLNTNAKIFWVLFEDYFLRLPIVTGYSGNSQVDGINHRLQGELYGQVTFIDLKSLIASIGIGASFSVKDKYRWNYPYSKQLTEVVAAEIQKQCFIHCGVTKKCLVMDCDNVLWGGVLSEVGMENLRLGRSGLGREFQEFQRFALSLYYRGVILAICSKNEIDDVLCVFREHNEMILKEQHIACFQVNWESKPYNIKKIADTLNICTDSMVFVDDSTAEIAAVKAVLPEVTTILYQRENMYSWFSCFNLENSPEFDAINKRNETYQTNGLRDQLKLQFENHQEYLSALEMKIDIHTVQPTEYARMAELTQRTNQCTNGTRYTIDQIKERAEDATVSLYSVFLSDRYCDLGLVGALEVQGSKLSLFSLSCRALGREIERYMLNFLKENHEIDDIEFQNTQKNAKLSKLLADYYPCH